VNNRKLIRIHKLQDNIKGMYENIRRYNLRINEKDEELDKLINDSNDDYYEHKQKVIIKKKIKKHEDTIIQLEKFIYEERAGISKVNAELDYLLDQVNTLRNSV
jgi:predicted RNase H-like nuclease (RuvC/YqgF family)